MAYLHAWSMYGAEAFEGPQLAAHYPTPPPEPLAAVAVRDVYLSHLPEWATEEWLRDQFQQNGEVVVTARILPGGRAGKPYGFVQIEEPVELAPGDPAAAAAPPPGGCNLYAAGLPAHYTEPDVAAVFGPFGPIESLVVLKDAVTSLSRGTAMVQFHDPYDATNAMCALHGAFLPGHDRPMEVRYARNAHQKAPRSLRPGRGAGPGAGEGKAKSPPPSRQSCGSRGTSARSQCGSEGISDSHSLPGSSAAHDDLTLCLGMRELEEGLQALAEGEEDAGPDPDGDGGLRIPVAAFARPPSTPGVSPLLRPAEAPLAPPAAPSVASSDAGSSCRASEGRDSPRRTPSADICNVYVSNIPMPKDDEWLAAVFAKFGTVLSAKVMLTRRASDRPYGFVQFTDPAIARAAVQAMDGVEVEGSVLHVKVADREKHAAGQHPSADIYISNLPLDYGAREIALRFGTHGAISSLVVLTDDKGRSRGLAVIHYFQPEAAATAIAQWHGRPLPGHPRPLEVMYAKAKHCRAAGKHRAITNPAVTLRLDNAKVPPAPTKATPPSPTPPPAAPIAADADSDAGDAAWKNAAVAGGSPPLLPVDLAASPWGSLDRGALPHHMLWSGRGVW